MSLFDDILDEIEPQKICFKNFIDEPALAMAHLRRLSDQAMREEVLLAGFSMVNGRRSQQITHISNQLLERNSV